MNKEKKIKNNKNIQKDNLTKEKKQAKLIQLIVDEHGVRQQTFGYDVNDIQEIIDRTNAIMMSGIDNLLRMNMKHDNIVKYVKDIITDLEKTQNYGGKK